MIIDTQDPKWDRKFYNVYVDGKEIHCCHYVDTEAGIAKSLCPFHDESDEVLAMFPGMHRGKVKVRVSIDLSQFPWECELIPFDASDDYSTLSRIFRGTVRLEEKPRYS